MKKNILLFTLLVLPIQMHGESEKTVAPEQARPEVAIASKKLVCEAVQTLITVLNLPFVSKTEVGKKLFIGLEASRRALSSIESYNKKYPDSDPRFTPDQKKKLDEKITAAIKKTLLASVGDVFPILYTNRIIIRKLVVESLGAKETLFHKFFDSTLEGSKTFFNDKIKTKEDLNGCCRDFIKVFGDLELTIPDVFDLGRQEIAKLEAEAAAAKEKK
jgi:hypothetical protein